MMTQDLYSFTQAPIPPSCAAAFPGSKAWRCLWPSDRLPFITTNYCASFAALARLLLTLLSHPQS